MRLCVILTMAILTSGCSITSNSKQFTNNLNANTNAPAIKHNNQAYSAQSQKTVRRKAELNSDLSHEKIKKNILGVLRESKITSSFVSLGTMQDVKSKFNHEDKTLTLDSPFFITACDGDIVWPFASSGDGKGKPKGTKIEFAISAEDGRIIAARMKGKE